MKTFSIGALGVLLLGIGAFFVFSDYVDGSWPRVPGTVIGSRTVNDSKSSVVEYAASGTTFQVISSNEPLLGSSEAGEKHTIAYNPNSPGEAKIVQSGFLAIMPWVLVAAGAVLVLASAIMRRRQRDDESEDTLPQTSLDSTDTTPNL